MFSLKNYAMMFIKKQGGNLEHRGVVVSDNGDDNKICIKLDVAKGDYADAFRQEVYETTDDFPGRGFEFCNYLAGTETGMPHGRSLSWGYYFWSFNNWGGGLWDPSDANPDADLSGGVAGAGGNEDSGQSIYDGLY